MTLNELKNSKPFKTWAVLSILSLPLWIYLDMGAWLAMTVLIGIFIAIGTPILRSINDAETVLKYRADEIRKTKTQSEEK